MTMKEKIKEAIATSKKIYSRVRSSRSDSKIIPLQIKIASLLQEKLNHIAPDTYEVYAKQFEGRKEMNVVSKINPFYSKNVDIGVYNKIKGVQCGASELRSPESSLQKNENNFFENILGQVSMLKHKTLPYSYILSLNEKTPLIKSGEFQKDKKGNNRYDDIKLKHIAKYMYLMKDRRRSNSFSAFLILISRYDDKEETVELCKSGDLFKKDEEKARLTKDRDTLKLIKKVRKFIDKHNDPGVFIDQMAKLIINACQ